MSGYHKIKTPYNSTYPIVAVQWLNQSFCLYQADSEVLRNSHLRVVAKHCVPPDVFGLNESKELFNQLK